ncbi:hypothetical protein ACIG53_13460 [Streptomyces bauhiniae]|uniref:hypothetical protein n=1 Tax=Streptomyces bauhiniae TaxID=2340725 RepID=UPI0037CE5641
MQFIITPGGDEVAVIRPEEVLVVEGALSLYVTKHPDSNIAIRVLREVSSANESRAERMEAEVERTCA